MAICHTRPDKMKLILSLLFSCCCLSSFSQRVEDLGLFIDSVARTVLDFKVDSAAKATRHNSPAHIKIKLSDAVTVPDFPAIIVNGRIFRRSQIPANFAAVILECQTIEKSRAESLFARQGSLGAIFLRIEKRTVRQLRKFKIKKPG
jgi:hypothetical protein